MLGTPQRRGLRAWPPWSPGRTSLSGTSTVGGGMTDGLEFNRVSLISQEVAAISHFIRGMDDVRWPGTVV